MWTKTNNHTKEDLLQVFEIIDGDLWRKGYLDALGRNCPRRKVENKVNSSNGYCQARFKGRMMLYHRIVWILLRGDIPKKMLVDHIDGNKINNNIDNLRIVTHRQNLQNTRKHRAQKRLPGCCFNKVRKKWQVNVFVKGRRFFVGDYSTEQEAHEAYINYIKENCL